ncbi:hypothetical protein [Enterobacter asburiae]|uniref:hypothetical protein n=1 Tax=Enterobacter asburiae TaxID=61645 RepID=UPI001E63088C|nr:hypothetical protein [Enterobacter asburiae]MCE2004282.1 hypothetical protein [Enterobacter asburiae]
MQIKPKTDKTAAITALATDVFAPVCILNLMATNMGTITDSKYRIWKVASCQKTTDPDIRIINKYMQKKTRITTLHQGHSLVLATIFAFWWYGINYERNI